MLQLQGAIEETGEQMWRVSALSVEELRVAPGAETKGSEREGGALAATEVFDFADKIAGVAELAIDGGKADIGDFVQLLEGIHDLFADGRGGNFPSVFLLEILNQLICRLINKFRADRPLFAGLDKAHHSLAAVERFVTPVPFDDPEILTLDPIS